MIFVCYKLVLLPSIRASFPITSANLLLWLNSLEKISYFITTSTEACMFLFGLNLVDVEV